MYPIPCGAAAEGGVDGRGHQGGGPSCPEGPRQAAAVEAVGEAKQAGLPSLLLASARRTASFHFHCRKQKTKWQGGIIFWAISFPATYFDAQFNIMFTVYQDRADVFLGQI